MDLFKNIKNFGPDVLAEGKRQAIQGSMEICNALFNGSGFVPYGPGQYTPDHTQQQHGQQQQEDGAAQQAQQGRNGRERDGMVR